MNGIDEVLEVSGRVLIRSALFGFALLLFWWAALLLTGDFVYGLHSKMAPMSREQFDVIHYTGMLATKVAIWTLFLFPYLGIRLVSKRRQGAR